MRRRWFFKYIYNNRDNYLDDDKYYNKRLINNQWCAIIDCRINCIDSRINLKRVCLGLRERDSYHD